MNECMKMYENFDEILTKILTKSKVKSRKKFKIFLNSKFKNLNI